VLPEPEGRRYPAPKIGAKIMSTKNENLSVESLAEGALPVAIRGYNSPDVFFDTIMDFAPLDDSYDGYTLVRSRSCGCGYFWVARSLAFTKFSPGLYASTGDAIDDYEADRLPLVNMPFIARELTETEIAFLLSDAAALSLPSEHSQDIS